MSAPDAQGCCDHGQRVYRHGIARNGRAWRGLFCRLRECDTVWLHAGQVTTAAPAVVTSGERHKTMAAARAAWKAARCL